MPDDAKPTGITGSGSGATFVPTIVNGVITELTMTSGGPGYTAPPLDAQRWIDYGRWGNAAQKPIEPPKPDETWRDRDPLL